MDGAVVGRVDVVTCHRCHRPHGKGKRETRPYGPDGAPLCAGCMFGEDGATPDPDVQAEAKRQFADRLAAAERASADGRAIIADDMPAGPMPHRPRNHA